MFSLDITHFNVETFLMQLSFDGNAGNEQELLRLVETLTWSDYNGYFGVKMYINEELIFYNGAVFLHDLLLKLNNVFYQLLSTNEGQKTFDFGDSNQFKFSFKRDANVLFINIEGKDKTPINLEKTEFNQAVLEVVKAIRYYKEIISAALKIALPNRIDEATQLLINGKWLPLAEKWSAFLKSE